MKEKIYKHLYILIAKMYFFILFFFVGLNCFAQNAPLIGYTSVVNTGFTFPLEIANAKDGSNRLFIVEQGGKVRIVAGGVLLPDAFLNISDSITATGERGLLSIAFHPSYATNGYFFVYYTNLQGDITVARFRVQAGNPNAADLSTWVVLLKIPKLYANHNGGHLAFGPDGYLYFGTGDGGSGGDPNANAQNGNSLLGKMLRINVNDFTAPAPYYTIPADNPFVTNASVRDEIYGLGLRNPFRWSFDRLTGDCWIADVGQNLWEEVNTLPFANTSGANYGWRCYEGNAAYNTAGCLPQSSYVSPVFVYPHDAATGGFSITGGYVYRGAQYAAMYGYYLCADFSSANLWLIKPDGNGGWAITQQSGLPASIAAFGEAEDGELYAVSIYGILYRITATITVPVTLQYFTVKSSMGFNDLEWEIASSQAYSRFEIEFSTDGNRFQNAGNLSVPNNAAPNIYRFQHTINMQGQFFYRLKMISRSGSITYSQIIRLNNNEKGDFKIYPTIVTNAQINITTSAIGKQVAIFSTDGKIVFEKKLNDVTGVINCTIPSLSKGIYFLRLETKERYFTEKIVVQ